MIAIELNNRVIAIARAEDIVDCHNDTEANTLRAAGYVPIGEGTTSRPATKAECDAYRDWLERGRAC